MSRNFTPLKCWVSQYDMWPVPVTNKPFKKFIIDRDHN